MNLNVNAFDLWVFDKSSEATKYLLLHSSQEKADKWFGGGRFWQVPTDIVPDDEKLVEALHRNLQGMGLQARSLWAVEHIYTIYNRRYDEIMIIPVFAAEVAGTPNVPLTWEHSESGWYTADECFERLDFRGLQEGLKWTREYITEPEEPSVVFRLA
jgi:hypothetical protein